MTLRKRRREQTEDYILAAATKEFSARGYHGVSMDDIAKAVDCAPATLYGYFKGKSELFTRLMTEKAQLYLMGVTDAVTGAGDFRAGLTAYLEHFLGFGRENEAFLKLMINVMRGGDCLDIPDAEQVEQAKKMYRGLIAGLMKTGIDEGSLREENTTLLALSFLGQVHAMSIAWLEDETAGGGANLESVVRLAEQQFLYGATHKSPGNDLPKAGTGA